VFNAVVILNTIYIMITFLNVAIPVELKDNLGWGLMLLMTFNICVHLCFIVYFTSKDIYGSAKHKHQEMKTVRMLLKRAKNRQKLIQQFPNKF